MPTIDRAACEAMDRDDPLAPARVRFHLPDGVIYLDGNSLGALPRATPERLARLVTREWGDDLITGWNKHGWVELPRRLGAKIAPLVGAQADEVLVCDSTSLNVFKLLSAALSANPQRRLILSDSGNFPTDLYMAQGLAALLGRDHRLELVPPEGVMERLAEDVAVVMLTEVDYRTGRRHDMAAINERARSHGVLTLWDLAHSAGAMPVELDRTGADFAVGCGYKYLNGGPGAPAFLFVARHWQDRAQQPLFGWFGHARPFDFDTSYAPRDGIDRFQVGTPPVISMAALECGLDTFAGIDLQQVRAKSLALGDLMIRLVEQQCAGFGLSLASPPAGAARGSQVSYAHGHGYAVMQALIARGVIGDFRAPDLLRFGFTPLYLRFADIWDAVAVLRTVLMQEEWRRPEFHQRAAVT
ncbi:kynureninase [Dongia mobilis]|uniref:Kynureninase n=1 Tax=Dongia mobilis TaxID=578943 RepID=A0A4R6WS31_9PROT|nr:kynureninase [Dongia mobilis]TDQ84422.1 kynureninase [Dongia mobilis]